MFGERTVSSTVGLTLDEFDDIVWGLTSIYDFLGMRLKVQRGVAHGEDYRRCEGCKGGTHITISHIWADGLGGTTEARLPAYQLVRIASSARELVSDGAFWVEDLRKAAIRLMAGTYLRADEVFFYAGIRQRCTAAARLKDTALWIATSCWMQRVWTAPRPGAALRSHRRASIDGSFAGSARSAPWVDVAKLLAEDDADTRMLGFLLELKTLPARIPVNGTLKLPFLGLRWASRSLSAVGHARCNPGTATCTVRGLTAKGKFPVIVLGSTLRAGSRIAMAVHIPHLVFPPNAPSTDDEPMLCEGLFYLGLAEVPPHLDRIGNGRLGAPWWKEDLPWCSATTYTAESTNSPGGCHSRDVMGERLTGILKRANSARIHCRRALCVPGLQYYEASKPVLPENLTAALSGIVAGLTGSG
ncbi:hypothetical protein C8Q76DRAFT_698353 [Earliella scabrosa]|nr:hypothetical protein C8Q76DRAFT_698353 [Earliella scabrosa]